MNVIEMIKIKPTFYGKVEDKKLVLDDPKALTKQIAKFDGKKVRLSIEAMRDIRSVKQNAYYWGVVLPILSDETGHTAEEMHGTMALEFLSFYDAQFKVTVIRSTTSLNKGEFIEYTAKIRQWASQFGILIPEPNEDITSLIAESYGKL